MPEYLQPPASQKPGGGGHVFFVVLLLALGMMFAPMFLGQRPQNPQNETGAVAEQKTDGAAAIQAAPNVGVAYKIEKRTLENDSYKLVMTNAGGGRVSDFYIKVPDRYQEHGTDGSYIRSQKPQSEHFGGLLPLKMTLPAFRVNGETQFQITSDATDSSKIAFHYETPDGTLAVDKTFEKTDKPYTVRANVTLSNKSNQPMEDVLTTELAIKQVEGEEPGMFTPGSYVSAKCFAKGKMEYLDATDKEEEESYKKDVGWTAIDESYFAIAVNYNDPNEGVEGAVKRSKYCNLSNDGEVIKSQLLIPLQMAPNSQETLSFDIYMGPKEADYLKPFGHNLESIIDYGMIAVLAKPMAWILAQFHDMTGDWGLAIIILTLIVRLALWPLAQKGQLGMMAMSKLAPMMQELQEKYKDDQQMLAQKQMELYKQYNMNPMAGCLPLLIQMPVFFALYRCIFVTGGLYHAPLLNLWIKDLSAPDPYFILPVLSVVLLVSQQLLTPTQTKGMQQRVMMVMMPLIFGVMMLFLPSGLCIYMIVSSGISMIQSFYVRRLAAKMDFPTPSGVSADGDAKNATVDV